MVILKYWGLRCVISYSGENQYFCWLLYNVEIAQQVIVYPFGHYKRKRRGLIPTALWQYMAIYGSCTVSFSIREAELNFSIWSDHASNDATSLLWGGTKLELNISISIGLCFRVCCLCIFSPYCASQMLVW